MHHSKSIQSMMSAVLALCAVWPAHADDLFVAGMTKSLSSDRKASLAGDLITIVVVQAAESSTSTQHGSQKSTTLDGHLGVGSIDENAGLALRSNFNGRGEMRRSERFVTQLTASVTGVLANGDMVIAGAQKVNIDGEATLVEVRGRIRPADIDAENRVFSNRIANAEINYNGKGFASRSARPGLIQRLFGLLGLN